MPWNRNDSDPIENKRRELAEQERLLAEQMSRLTEVLQQSGQPAPIDPKEAEPPVWRMEDDARAGHRVPEQLPARRGVLARQRRRDMLLFFFFIGLFIFVLIIVIWVFCTHDAPNTTSLRD
jgi:hypothetical protein